MKVLLQRLKSNHSSPRARKGPHARTHLLWKGLLYSLAADPIITLWTPSKIPGEVAIQLAILNAVIILPFLAQNSLHVTLSKLRNLHLRSIERSTSVMPLLVVALVGLGVAMKAALIFNLPRSLAVVILLFLVPALLKQFREAQTRNREDQELFSKNPWAKVQRWEQQMVLFVTLPLVLARLIGVYGALSIPPEGEGELFRVTFTIISGLFLGMLQPIRSNFVGICRKCKSPVPIVFQDVGSCLQCDGWLRASFHAWRHGQPFQLPSSNPPTSPSTTEGAGEQQGRASAPQRKRSLPSKPRK